MLQSGLEYGEANTAHAVLHHTHPPQIIQLYGCLCVRMHVCVYRSLGLTEFIS